MESRRLALGSLVRTGTKAETESVGEYMSWPLVSLERLAVLDPEGKLGYRWGRERRWGAGHSGKKSVRESELKAAAGPMFLI